MDETNNLCSNYVVSCSDVRKMPSPSPSSSSPVKSHNYNNPRKKQRTKFIKIGASETAGISKPKPSSSRRLPADSSSAPKITRPCTECGKKFWSWKALFGHMRCHPERQWRGINPPPNVLLQSTTPTGSEAPPAAEDFSTLTEEDHKGAASLLMLANSPAAASDNSILSLTTVNQQGMPPENCSDSGRDAADLCMVEGTGPSGINGGRFECSSCKKVFGSHQALGGHRASHKNVKGCYANTKNGDGEEEGCCIGGGVGEGEVMINKDSSNNNNSDRMAMGLGHKCSICLRVFSSGQALGGHKRCHWEKVEEPSSGSGLDSHRVLGLDLNLPPPAAAAVEDDDDASSSSNSSALNLDLRLGL